MEKVGTILIPQVIFTEIKTFFFLLLPQTQQRFTNSCI